MKTTKTSRSLMGMCVLLACASFGTQAGTPTDCIKERTGTTPNCTANDVVLTGVSTGSVVVLDDGCTSSSDTVTFRAKGTFTLQSGGGGNQQRFDLGVFISTDDDSNNDGAKSGMCYSTLVPNSPDPPFVNIDGDTCGDIDTAHSPIVGTPIGPGTCTIGGASCVLNSDCGANGPCTGGGIIVQCVDKNNDGIVDLIQCSSWTTSGNQNSVCNSSNDVKPGDKSKCDCCDPTLPPTDSKSCGAITNLCLASTCSVCQGTCSNNGATCQSSNDCPSGGVCQNITAQPANAGAVCRASAGDCDVEEKCTGTSTACPNDTFKPSTTTCRASAGDCDVAESCPGTSAACPADSFKASTTICRPVNGDCDVAESCPGTSGACPADSFKASTTICRAANGDCDVAASCPGTRASRPVDSFKPSTTICRASAGDCDVADSCTGTSATSPDSFKPSTTECRASAGACDVAESCPGTGAACPADAFKPSTTECRASAGACDVAECCPGTGPACPAGAFKPSTTECRASAGACDGAEFCPGGGRGCGGDGLH